MPALSKESDKYPSRVAGQDQEIDGNFHQQLSTFDNPDKPCKPDKGFWVGYNKGNFQTGSSEKYVVRKPI